MSTYQNICDLCRQRGITVSRLEKELGLSNGYVGHLRDVKHSPSYSRIALIADYFGVGIKSILDDQASGVEVRRVPLLGSAACGKPIEAVENVLGWEDFAIPRGCRDDFFALKMQGDSMSPEGSIAIAAYRPYADDGDIVIAKIGGDECCCKRFHKYADGIILQSVNPAYPPMYFSAKQVEDMPVTIIGKVVEVRTRYAYS